MNPIFEVSDHRKPLKVAWILGPATSNFGVF